MKRMHGGPGILDTRDNKGGRYDLSFAEIRPTPQCILFKGVLYTDADSRPSVRTRDGDKATVLYPTHEEND